ncbi:alpha/beta hydrolase [Kribbella pittospori]|uniref:Alpha/beta hydrolase n=1 Tax=Kribbella pittospori TaxID=722689 RepID=A0A4R0K2M5_9ACTN|nr:alpha/beta hydrolase [Kribbella pittospori]TCC54231.1 alpha/beta hydrolase [Kribbella pittospori]
MPSFIERFRAHRRRVVATALATVVAASGLTLGTTAVPSAAHVDDSSLSWTPCPGVPEPSLGLECTTVTVPLDYAKPAGEKIEIAVSRLPSTNPARRRGVLLLNIGGQGDSQAALPLALVSLGLPASVRETYDLIEFDPRGIGRSTPLTCNLRPDQAATLIPPPYARTAADVNQRAADARQIAEQCAQSGTAHLLPYITNTNVARDMDRIRQALGEQRISYLGYSHGTYLGTLYAALFPKRTDRMVFDSVSGLGGLDAVGARRWGLGFELRFPDFARWAASQDATYGLGATPAQVRTRWLQIVDNLDQAPVAGISGAALRAMTYGMLFNDSIFPALASALQALAAGQAPQLPPPPAGGDFSGMLALVCNSPGWSRDIDTYQRHVAVDRLRYPLFGPAAASVWPCAFWPAKPEPRVDISKAGSSTILLVNNLRDPATPYVGAVELHRTLGARSRLVTADQGGHLSYLFGNNTCAKNLETTFLVDGKRPSRDTFCPSA